MKKKYIISVLLAVIILLLPQVSANIITTTTSKNSEIQNLITSIFCPPFISFNDTTPQPQFFNTRAKIAASDRQSITGMLDFMIEQINETTVYQYIYDLVSFGPRRTNYPACDAAGVYIYNQFASMNLSVEYQNWTSGSYHGSNIEGTLPGIDPTSDEIFVVCAHYDSVSGSPGADDNAGGTAAVMAAAEIMSQYEFNHTVRFVAFSGEEQGLIGSSIYANQAAANNDNIIAVLNADMIGFAVTAGDFEKTKIYSNSASTWLFTYASNIALTYDSIIDLDIIDSGYASNSDHYSFWSSNFDAIMYHEYHFNPYYHSSQDTIANMNLSYDKKITQLIVATLCELAEPILVKIEEVNVTNGWNFISAAANQTVSILQQNISIFYNNTTLTWSEAVTNANPTGSPLIDQNMFGWDRIAQSYLVQDDFNAGNGYWLYSYEPCTIVFSNLSRSYNSVITLLEENWNIIGLPSNIMMNTTDIVTMYNGSEYLWSNASTNNNPTGSPLIDSNMFGWDALTQAYYFSDQLQPGEAYWNYAYQQCKIKNPLI